MYIIIGKNKYNNVTLLTSGDNIVFVGSTLKDKIKIDDIVNVYTDEHFNVKRYNPKDYKWQTIKDGEWEMTNISYGNTVIYNKDDSIEYAMRLFVNGKTPKTADEIIVCSALFDEWKSGVHTKGEKYIVNNDPWECIQDYDNATYPDIVPGNAAWFTFNKPFHGTSKETAREFVHPTGAHDIYKAGEWAIQHLQYTKCVADTAYSIDEYAAAWAIDGAVSDGTEVEPTEPDTPDTPTDNVPDFVQPTGAHDAYKKGDKVKFEGKVYESLIDANVYSPSAYPAGWKEITE